MAEIKGMIYLVIAVWYLIGVLGFLYVICIKIGKITIGDIIASVTIFGILGVLGFVVLLRLSGVELDFKFIHKTIYKT